MRYGIISDIHGNLPALETVLSHLRKQVDAFICLGDIVGYGAQPNECCELIKELKPIIVAGNHDWGAVGKIPLEHFNPYAQQAIIWTRANLTSGNWEFLASLPKTRESPLFTLVHGSLVNPLEEYILSSPEARDSLSFLTSKILFFGHTHIPTVFYQDEPQSFWVNRLTIRDNYILDLKKLAETIEELEEVEVRFLINPGSVGQPRDRDPRASAVIFDSKRMKVIFKRYEYPIEEAQRKILLAGLPPVLAERLSFGW